jgi:methylated-DNA-[protein]-cysteine S-methyltransferase
MAIDDLFILSLNTSIGDIFITSDSESIIAINFSFKGFKATKNAKAPKCLREAKKQLLEYFKGERKSFDLSLKKTGTSYQNQVWKALKKIPYGKTKSYKDIAVAISNPKSFRAVGMANNRNPYPIIIPCHRVIQNDGKLGGYAGGLKVKSWLLKLESEIS